MGGRVVFIFGDRSFKISLSFIEFKGKFFKMMFSFRISWNVVFLLRFLGFLCFSWKFVFFG